MAEKFIIRPKKTEKRDAESVVVSLRMEKSLQQAFDKLAAQSDRSRNELMCMALRYALEHLEFVPEGK